MATHGLLNRVEICSNIGEMMAGKHTTHPRPIDRSARASSIRIYQRAGLGGMFSSLAMEQQYRYRNNNLFKSFELQFLEVKPERTAGARNLIKYSEYEAWCVSTAPTMPKFWHGQYISSYGHHLIIRSLVPPHLEQAAGAMH